jgi:acyl carrier protein
MQIHSLNSFTPISSPPAPVGQPIPAVEPQQDVLELGQTPTAPSQESMAPSRAASLPVEPPAVAKTAAPPVPTVLLSEATEAAAPAAGINLQEAIQQAASASGLSESGAAAALSKADLELDNDNPDPHHVADRVAKIVKDQLKVEDEQITPEASYQEDLGADSLDTVELLMGFQEEFAIEIPEEDAANLTTVGETVTYIQKRLQDTPPPSDDL